MVTWYQATVQMISVFRPCPAAKAVPAAISTMPATSATGGASRRTMRATPGIGACTTTTTTCTRAATARQTCVACAVFGTLRPRNSAAIAPRRPDPRLLRHRARPLLSRPPKSSPSHNLPTRPRHNVYYNYDHTPQNPPPNSNNAPRPRGPRGNRCGWDAEERLRTVRYRREFYRYAGREEVPYRENR